MAIRISLHLCLAITYLFFKAQPDLSSFIETISVSPVGGWFPYTFYISDYVVSQLFNYR